MLRFFCRKFFILFLTFLGVSVLAFGLIRLVPGDPVLLMLGERGGDPARYKAMEKNLGLDRPLVEQYFHYIFNVFQGDLGTSIVSKRPVSEEFFGRFPATVELGLLSIFLALLLGVPCGIIAAVKKNSLYDNVLMGISLIGYSMPIFWWGLILILFFSVHLGWTPVSGRISAIYDVEFITGFMLVDTWFSEDGIDSFWSALRHLILPTLALSTIPLAVVARMTRSSMIEVLNEEYIRGARAKGLSNFRVIFVHGLRNALIPVVTITGLMVGTVLAGAILTETIFSWPGIGRWIVESVTARDYPVIQGGILCIALVIMTINMLVDFSYLIIDPKLRVYR